MIHDITYFMDLDNGNLYKRFIYDVTPEEFCTWYIRESQEWKEVEECNKDLNLVKLSEEQFEFWDDITLLSKKASYASMEFVSDEYPLVGDGILECWKETKTEPIKFTCKANHINLVQPPDSRD